MSIKFYSSKEQYGCFSNFSPHSFELDGKRWPTSEHYFQAQKFIDSGLQEKVRSAETPKGAALIGRDKTLPLRQDWENIKEDVMRKALKAKFTQNADIKTILLDTRPHELIEDSPIDYYWGCGKDGTGRNRLGVLLTELREMLVSE